MKDYPIEVKELVGVLEPFDCGMKILLMIVTYLKCGMCKTGAQYCEKIVS